ncbi:MAG: hypothetical protein ACOYXT_17355 [Bacteroidota bacterium]
MQLERHPVWTALYDDISLKDFIDRVVPKIQFKSEVHEDIKKAFATVQNLLIQSYYDYQFLDVAYAKALHYLEMALKLRARDVDSTLDKDKSDERTLSPLVQWFASRNYFEVQNPAFIKRISQARNHFSHPKRHGFAGTAGLHWIDTVVDLINDLYENVELRLERFETQKRLQKEISQVINPTASFTTPGFSELIYLAHVFFVDNKMTPNLVYVAFYPVFTDPENQKIPFAIQLFDTFIKASEKEIEFITAPNFELKLTQTTESDIVEESKAWLHSWQNQDNNQDLKFKGRMYAKQSFMMLKVDELFIKTRKAFHLK